MKKLLSLLLVIIFVNVSYGQENNTIYLDSTWRPIADSREFKGQIQNPKICPADTTLISFEVSDISKIRLYIFNTKTNVLRQIVSKSYNDDPDREFNRKSDINKNLAWRPVRDKQNQVWAAFIGNVTGVPELYLYNYSTDNYYLLRTAADSTSPSSKFHPSWSPEGQCLTFVGTERGSMDIFILKKMNTWLQNPKNPVIPQEIEQLVYGPGDQSNPEWCPVENSGYIAYTNKGIDKRFEIKVFDCKSKLKSSYPFIAPETDRSYFAPSWNILGNKLAYYQSKNLKNANFDEEDLKEDYYELGIASLVTFDDSLIIRQIPGGRYSETNVLNVAPNNDRFLPPSWSNNGIDLLVPMYDEQNSNPFRQIRSKHWEYSGMNTNEWLIKPEGFYFNFPRDISIVNRSISFTYSEGQTRSLIIGQISPKSSYMPDEKANTLEITKDRYDWYPDWSKGKDPGFFDKVIGFFIKPRFIDKGILVNNIAAGLGTALLIWCPWCDDPTINPVRDWNLPYLNNVKTNRGISLSYGF